MFSWLSLWESWHRHRRCLRGLFTLSAPSGHLSQRERQGGFAAMIPIHNSLKYTSEKQKGV